MTYNQKYSQKNEERRKEVSKRVGIDFKKEYYNDKLKPAADSLGMTVNGFIKSAIDEKIARMEE